MRWCTKMDKYEVWRSPIVTVATTLGRGSADEFDQNCCKIHKMAINKVAEYDMLEISHPNASKKGWLS